MRPLASTGSAGKIGDVHIDAILAVRQGDTYDETEVNVESGAPASAHRQRVREPLELDILVSDAEGASRALLVGLWELNHASQTKDRIRNLALLGSTVKVFDGRVLRRAGSGSSDWRVISWRDTTVPGETGVFRATVVFAEAGGFATSFTQVSQTLAESEQDAADGIVDSGQQSTETVPGELAAQIPT
jgi:hypothetical protein